MGNFRNLSPLYTKQMEGFLTKGFLFLGLEYLKKNSLFRFIPSSKLLWLFSPSKRHNGLFLLLPKVLFILPSLSSFILGFSCSSFFLNFDSSFLLSSHVSFLAVMTNRSSSGETAVQWSTPTGWQGSLSTTPAHSALRCTSKAVYATDSGDWWTAKFILYRTSAREQQVSEETHLRKREMFRSIMMEEHNWLVRMDVRDDLELINPLSSDHSFWNDKIRQKRTIGGQRSRMGEHNKLGRINVRDDLEFSDGRKHPTLKLHERCSRV